MSFIIPELGQIAKKDLRVLFFLLCFANMLAIIGLGNPGERFKKTRHNLGFLILDAFSKKNNFGSWKEGKKPKAVYSKKIINNKEIELVKPLTLMNNSGQTVKYILQKHGLQIDDIVVVHDDIDIPFGEIKISQKRGSAGHKGIQSIIDKLGSKDFARVRVGIKPLEAQVESVDWCDFVLDSFTQKEKKVLKKTLISACNAIEFIIEKGIEQAMTECN